MARKKKSEYTGKLNDPIKIDLTKTFDRQGRTAYVAEQYFEKLALLAQYYNIDCKKEGWPLLLVFALAEKHVPGFKTVSPEISQEKWSGFKGFNFFLEIEEIRNNESCTVDAAIEKYILEENCQDENYIDFENLKRRYYEIKDIQTNNTSVTAYNYALVKQSHPEINNWDDFYSVTRSGDEKYIKNFNSAEIND